MIFVYSVIMTMFLWHLSAMLMGIGILFPLGFPQPEPGSAQWWALRPVWVGVLLVLLAGFVMLFGRFEQRGLGLRAPQPAEPSAASVATAAVAAALLVMGVLGFAMGGMHQLFSKTGTELIIFSLNPFHNVLHLLLGGAFLWASIRRPPAIRTVSALGGAALVILTVVGIAMASDPEINYLAANTADNVFHGVLAGIALGLVATATPSPVSGE